MKNIYILTNINIKKNCLEIFFIVFISLVIIGHLKDQSSFLVVQDGVQDGRQRILR